MYISHIQLCDPLGCSLTGSSVHGMSQARILESVAMSFSRDSPNPGIEPVSPALAGGFFPTSLTWESQKEMILVQLK